MEEACIPDACLQDNEITIKIKRLSGTIAVLSGIEIEVKEVGGGGPQGGEAQITRPFYFEKIYPNPFKEKVIIRYMIQDAGYIIQDARYRVQNINLKIYDVTGRMVRDFSRLTVNGDRSTIVWDGTDDYGRRLPSGVYFVQLEADGFKKTEKVILLR